MVTLAVWARAARDFSRILAVLALKSPKFSWRRVVWRWLLRALAGFLTLGGQNARRSFLMLWFLNAEIGLYSHAASAAAVAASAASLWGAPGGPTGAGLRDGGVFGTEAEPLHCYQYIVQSEISLLGILEAHSQHPAHTV